jgi:tripartite-type tricarboxylate transporter receptor subunit TctC
MSIPRRNLLRSLSLPIAAGCAPLFRAKPAFSAAYPAHSIRLYVGFSPGGGVDLISRIAAEKLTQRFGQTVVVDNRTGASGNIAAATVAHAEPDGYSLLMVPIAHTVNPAVQKNLPFDPLRDFAPVTQLASAPNVLMINAKLGVSTLAEFIAKAKAEPGKIPYASSGIGTSTHLAMELFCQVAGIQLIHVPYRGGGTALPALLSNEVSAYFASVPAATGYMGSSELKALAVTGKTRSASLPNIPTAIEAGLPGYVYVGWYGLLATGGAPPEVVNILHDAVVEILKLPEVQKKLAEDGSEAVGSTPAEFAAFLAADMARWKKVFGGAGPSAGGKAP